MSQGGHGHARGRRRRDATRALALWFSLALAVPVAASPSAAGPVVPGRALRAAPGGALADAVAAARARDPVAFARVEAARRSLAESPHSERRAAVATLALRGDQGEAPWPLVAAVAAATEGEPAVGAALEVELGIVEALGARRDPRALPALEQWLARHRGDPRRTRAAVAAIGRIGDDTAVAVLLDLATRAPDDEAVLAALGECRRLPIAAWLAERLGAVVAKQTGERPTGTASRARLVVRAMRDVGAARVWATHHGRASGEGEAVRSRVVEALVNAVPAASPRLRLDIAQALLAVDHPATAQAVAALRAGGGPGSSGALDELEATLERLGRLAGR